MRVDNHRHCQATVLAATGIEYGFGATWDTISTLETQLNHLGTNWVNTYFYENNNITEDLAGILKLIDNVAGKIFDAHQGNLISIDEGTISVKNNISTGYNGLVGVSGTGTNRQLIEQAVTVQNINEDGQIIANLVVDGKSYPIRALSGGGGGQEPEPEPEPEQTTFTVRFIDYSGNVVDTQTVEKYGNATPPELISSYEVDGKLYQFRGWDKSWETVTQNLDIHAVYLRRCVVDKSHEYDMVFSGGENDGVLINYRDNTNVVINPNEGEGSTTIVYGGYEILDTTEEGDGIYDANTIQSYVSNPSKNYLWRLCVGAPDQSNGIVSQIEKQVHKDCVVYFDGLLYSSLGGITDTLAGIDPHWNYDPYQSVAQQRLYVYIDGVRVDISGLLCTNGGTTGTYKLCIKSGQTLKTIYNCSTVMYLSILPLKFGGSYFFDMKKPDKFQTGTFSRDNEFTFTATCPTLFAHGGTRDVGGNNSNTWAPQVNGKNVYLGQWSKAENGITQVILDTNDRFTTKVTASASSDVSWWAYPLLMETTN